MPIPQHYIAVRIAGKRYWAYGAKYTGDASTGVTIELTNLEPVEAKAVEADAESVLSCGCGRWTWDADARYWRSGSNYCLGCPGDGIACAKCNTVLLTILATPDPPECAEPTVTLQSYTGEELRFTRITSLGVRGRTGKGQYQTGVEGDWYDAEGKHSGGYILLHLSLMGIAVAARAAWGEHWTCEGAVQEVAEPTVTLHGRITGMAVAVSVIEKIEQDQGWAVVFGSGTDRFGQIYEVMPVTESAAEITEKARAVWGQYWSCPGCVDPEVTLPWANIQDLRWQSITQIEAHLTECTITGMFWGATTGEWTLGSVRCLMTPADIRAACEVAGVPCVGEEEPEHYHAGPFVGYDPAAKDGAGAFVRLTVERADDGGFRIIGIENVPVREEEDLRERVRATVWGNEKWKLKQQRDKARTDVAELCEQRDAAYRKRDDKHGEMIEAQNELAAVEAERDRLQAQLAEADPLSPEPEYPEAWKAKPQSFEAYGCSIELSEGHGWGYFVTSTDDIYGQPSTQGDSGMSKQEAIAAADVQAKAWGNDQ